MGSLGAVDFTGSNGDAFPTVAPVTAWTGGIVAGTFSVGPTADIQNNRGSVVATASASAAWVNLATVTGLPGDYEIRGIVRRSSFNLDVGLAVRFAGTDGYVARTVTVTSKGTTYGLQLARWNSGVQTLLTGDTVVSAAGTADIDVWVALRVETRPNGNVALHAKMWGLSDPEPVYAQLADDNDGTTASTADSVARCDGTASKITATNSPGVLWQSATLSTSFTGTFDDLTVSDLTPAPLLALPPRPPVYAPPVPQMLRPLSPALAGVVVPVDDPSAVTRPLPPHPPASPPPQQRRALHPTVTDTTNPLGLRRAVTRPLPPHPLGSLPLPQRQRTLNPNLLAPAAPPIVGIAPPFGSTITAARRNSTPEVAQP